MFTLIQDLRYGYRTLRKTPGFTLIAVLMLALGIGANSALFSVVHAVLLRPLPYPEPNKLLRMSEMRRGLPIASLSYLNYRDWEEQNHVFESTGAIKYQSFVLGGDHPELLPGAWATAGFFPTLGITPVLGREILASDDHPWSEPVVLISYKAWQERFSGSLHVIGAHVNLDESFYSVVGVLPADNGYLGGDADFIAPMGLRANASENLDRAKREGLRAVARLKAGVTMEQARLDTDSISARLRRLYPATVAEKNFGLESFYDDAVEDIRPWLSVLLVAVGLVLLIACANVANLLLARATARRQEMAIRMALGAKRSRLFQQMITESLLLALTGGILGTVAAAACLRLLLRVMPQNLPHTQAIHISGPVLAFTLAISLVTGVVFGLAPALQASRNRQSMAEGNRSSAGPGRSALRNLLVVGEVAVSMILLTAAGLLIHSFAHAMQVDPGLNSQNLIVADVHLSETRYHDDQQYLDHFFDHLTERLKVSAGISAAAVNVPTPFSGSEWGYGFMLEGEEAPTPERLQLTSIHYVSPEYLETAQIPLLQGRNLNDADNNSSPPVALVNRAFVARWLADQNPIGKRLRLGPTADLAKPVEQNPWFTVVGVVGDVKQTGLDQPQGTEVYLAFNQHQRAHRPITSRSVLIRFSSDALMAVQQLREAIHELDRNQPSPDIVTMDQLISRTMVERKSLMFLLTVFASLALLLAALGIYGVLSYWVLQRTREIGIRMALGADRLTIVQVVAGHGLRLMAAGLLIGVISSLAITRVLSAFLFQVKAHDPATYGAILVLFATVAAVACYAPARRAMKVDPVVALRHE
jgi:putative ABC transport system permease protein